MTDLNRTERHLLDWLAQDDATVVGSCRGPALSELVSRGLVVIVTHDRRGPDYDRVGLTAKGWLAVKHIKQGAMLR